MLTAPHDGVIDASNSLVEGQVVIGAQSINNGTTLMRVSDISVLRVDVNLNEFAATLVALGRTATVTFDSLPGLTKQGKVIVPKDKRITVKHVREMTDARMTRIAVPQEYLVGRVLAHAIIDKESGEIIANANEEVTEDVLKKGDTVRVITGKDKGKRGEVIRSIPDDWRVVVQGVNVVKRHTRPAAGQPGGIVEKEASIHVSNVMLVDPKTDKPTRVGHKAAAAEVGGFVRACKKCGEEI